MFETIITNVGLQKLAAAEAGNTTVSILAFAVGDGDGLPITPDPAASALINEVYRHAINTIYQDFQNPTQVVVEGIVPEGIGGFTIREAGLFDQDGDLFAIASTPDTYKPTVIGDNSAAQLYIRLVLEVANVPPETINLTVSYDLVIATQQWVEDHVFYSLGLLEPAIYNEVRKRQPVLHNEDFATAGAHTFTVPAGIKSVQVSACAAGGGGGGGKSYAEGEAGGGGGGAGQSCHRLLVTGLAPGGTISISIGSGGAAGTGGDTPTGGGNGADTTIGAVTLKGGQGGRKGSSTGASGINKHPGSGGAGGAGGVGGIAYCQQAMTGLYLSCSGSAGVAGGDYVGGGGGGAGSTHGAISGAGGGTGAKPGGAPGRMEENLDAGSAGGGGGASLFGRGGRGGGADWSDQDGEVAPEYGGGGGGGGTSGNGGAGAAGFVRIEWITWV